ncbi:LPS translocon maturation chaperone LptM [Pigmentiphaga kullae]|uniref:LPS translocon maturation chaperone LptM n=1 Tax=Pigmentiphaga kullae TaxID=151784 RepID=UPI00102BD63D|nr:lipoprotein [Pigmentiphaga kullae]
MVADTGIVASGARPALRRLVPLLAALPLVLLAACGIKGPLYLPATPAPTASAPAAQPAPAPASKTTGDIDDISRRNESLSHTPLTQ